MTPSANSRMRARSDSGTPISSEMTSMGSLPAYSAMKSKDRSEALASARSRCVRASATTCPSSSRILLGVNPFDTSVRSRRCSGSSMARNDMTSLACGPKDALSMETPLALESASLFRKPCSTSWCRDSAQNFSSSLR
ncbi:Uncharacterised protein [Mycobacteroides abscessus subsp. abscessus]|nr:Uncharacterised protein [Mycobacteroides abscessus subsp. abscessus]